MPILREVLDELKRQMAEEFAADIRCAWRMPRGVERAYPLREIQLREAERSHLNWLAAKAKRQEGVE